VIAYRYRGVYYLFASNTAREQRDAVNAESIAAQRAGQAGGDGAHYCEATGAVFAAAQADGLMPKQHRRENSDTAWTYSDGSRILLVSVTRAWDVTTDCGLRWAGAGCACETDSQDALS